MTSVLSGSIKLLSLATALVSATDGLIIDLLSDAGGSTRDRAAGRDRIVTTLLDIFAPAT